MLGSTIRLGVRQIGIGALVCAALTASVIMGWLLPQIGEGIGMPPMTYSMAVGGTLVVAILSMSLTSTRALVFWTVFVFSGGLTSFPGVREAYTWLRWLFIVFLAAKGILRILTKQLDGRLANMPGSYLIGGFCLYTFISMFYSVNRLLTLVRATSLTFLFIGLYSVIIPDHQIWTEIGRLLSVVYKAALAATMLGVALSLVTSPAVFPKAGHRFTSTFGNANGLALFSAMTLPLAIVEYYRTKRWAARMFALTLCGFLLTNIVLAQSRTGLWSGLAGLAVTVWRLPRQRGRTFVPILVVFIVMVTLGSLLVYRSLSVETYGRLAGQSIGLFESKARYELWKLALEYWCERPLIGYGFGATGYVWGDVDIPELDYQLRSGSASRVPNGYLDLAVQLGITGLVWILVILGKALRLGWQIRPEKEATVPVAALLGIVTVGMLNNMAEPWLTGVGGGVTIIFWLAVVLLFRLQAPAVNVNTP